MMLSFKNFVKQEEAFNPVNFAGGFATNLASQGIKSIGNLARGVGKTALGAVGTASGLVGGASHRILGDEENSNKSIDFAKKSIKTIGTGLTDIVKGTIQLGGAASLVTPFLRGMQASAEPMTPKRFNRNRNKIQRTFGLNSNKETPFIINGVPNNIEEMIKMIEEWYEEAINNREIQVKGRPEIFVKNLMKLYNSNEADIKINKKIKYLLNTYFSNFEVLIIEAGKFLQKIDNEIFFSNSRIVEYIEFLYNKSKSPNVILITQNNKIFLEELLKIYNNYLSSKNLMLGKKDPGSAKYIQDLRNKIIEIIARFLPNKKIKTKKSI